MSSKQSRSINLTHIQLKWLEARAKQLGITVSDVIRRIIDEKREEE